MTPQRWSVRKAVLYGAAFGIPIAILRAMFSEVLPATSAEFMGLLAAAMICGALLFAGVAAVKNLLTPISS